MVSTANMGMMVFDLIFSLAFPIALAIAIKKKWNTPFRVFFTGCLMWFAFASIAEQLLHSIVLASPVGGTIQNNIWIYALYGGICAALFEEFARLLAFKVLLKRDYDNNHNAIMYGAGHGGIEVIMVLGIGMINNLIYSFVINNGMTETILSAVPEAQRPQIEQIFTQLIEIKPYTFLASCLERVSAVLLHIALSVIVWVAVVYAKKLWFGVAMGIHFFVDASIAILASKIENVFIVEIVILALSLGSAFLAKKLWEANACQSCKTNDTKES